MTIEAIKGESNRYYTVIRVLIFYFLSVLILISLSYFSRYFPKEIADQLSIFIATIFTFLLMLLFIRWEKLELSDIGIAFSSKSTKRFIAGFVIGISMAVSQALIVLYLGHLQLVLVQNTSFGYIFLSLLLYFLIACREELVFRSYSLRSLNYSFNAAIALAIITLIFVLEHLAAGMDLKMAILGSGLGGILFGLAALKTRGLALPLGLHSAWNFGQWAMGFKNKPGIWNAIVTKGFESKVENIGLGAFVFVMLLSIIAVCIFYRNHSSK
jgi:CAAX protease family protein